MKRNYRSVWIFVFSVLIICAVAIAVHHIDKKDNASLSESCTITETETEWETADFGFGDEETEEPETDPIESEIEENGFNEEEKEENELLKTTSGYIEPERFKALGVVYFNGYRYTWYSEKVLPGLKLNIPGRHSDGTFVRDAENNICLASSDLTWGTYVDTMWGMGRVYDSGCASGTIDVYVSWDWHNKR